jgi:RNA polymerase-associated protein CTR9
VVESDSEGDDGAAEAAKEMDADVFGDEAPGDMDVDDEETVTVPAKRKNRRAMIDSDDEDEEASPPVRDDSPGTANGDGDTPMANNTDSDDE